MTPPAGYYEYLEEEARLERAEDEAEAWRDQCDHELLRTARGRRKPDAPEEENG